MYKRRWFPKTGAIARIKDAADRIYQTIPRVQSTRAGVTAAVSYNDLFIRESYTGGEYHCIAFVCKYIHFKIISLYIPFSNEKYRVKC